MVLQVVVWFYTMLKGATRWCVVLHDARALSRPSHVFREESWGRGCTGACVLARVYVRVFTRAFLILWPFTRCNM